MSRGLPYDSDAGRDYAAAITAVMHGAAYAQSSQGRPRSRRAVPGLRQEPRADASRDAQASLGAQGHRPHARADEAASTAPGRSGTSASSSASEHGYRNAQVTVLAPTGTIGFMMDCDTTGVEPDIALVKYKKLVGGGMMKIVNNTVPMALEKLGYTPRRDQRASSATSTSTRRSKGRRSSRTSTCPCSTARSSRPAARGRFTTWATSR